LTYFFKSSIQKYKEYIKNGKRVKVNHTDCLFDWYMANLITWHEIPTATVGIIESKSQKTIESTIATFQKLLLKKVGQN